MYWFNAIQQFAFDYCIINKKLPFLIGSGILPKQRESVPRALRLLDALYNFFPEVYSVIEIIA